MNKLIIIFLASFFAGSIPYTASKDKPVTCFTGTITPTERIPGQQDAKGDCNKIKQGGYMKFDLSKYEADKQIKRATLRVFLASCSGNRWRWVSQIKTDPVAGKIAQVFREIQEHKPLISRIVVLKKEHAGTWLEIPLKKNGVDSINNALAKKTATDRWIAMSFGFE